MEQCSAATFEARRPICTKWAPSSSRRPFIPSSAERTTCSPWLGLGGIDTAVISAVLDRVGLLQRSVDSYRSYSLGMKQRLGIAAALLASPELLILDEPTNGLDPAGIVEMRDLIRSLADEGMTVFVSSHLLAEIEHICDRLIMISDGKTVFQGQVAALRATRGDELVLRPEATSSLASLVALLQQAGFVARVEDDASGVQVVVVQAGSRSGGLLNRLAMDADITLIHISERSRSLEEAFFELTGSHSRDVVVALIRSEESSDSERISQRMDQAPSTDAAPRGLWRLGGCRVILRHSSLLSGGRSWPGQRRPPESAGPGPAKWPHTWDQSGCHPAWESWPLAWRHSKSHLSTAWVLFVSYWSDNLVGRCS